MSKISRALQKQFGVNGDISNFGQFGSRAAEDIQFTKSSSDIQSLPAFLEGMQSAVMNDRAFSLEDINSLFLLAFRQICYLLQQGIPEWNAETTYYIGSVVAVGSRYFRSLVDDNLNKDPLISSAQWHEIININTLTEKTNLHNDDLVMIEDSQASNVKKKTKAVNILPNSSVTDVKIANNAVTTDKINNSAVTASKLTGVLGSWASRSANTIYQAATDGMVVVYFRVVVGSSAMRYRILGYTDATSTPTTIRTGGWEGQRVWSSATLYGGLMMPVKKGDYYRITRDLTGTATEETLSIFWLPLGS